MEVERLVTDSASKKKEAEKLEFDTWPNYGNSSIFRTNFRSGVSSGSNRPIEAMIWIIEVESSKSIAELKTLNTTTGAELQTSYEVRFSWRRSCTERKSPSHGKAGRMEELPVLQGQRHGRI